MACKDGIVLQQSWLSVWPGDGHDMLSQHCMASSGVDMAEQSDAYAPRARTITAVKISLGRRILSKG
jgi:hypothetical protein